MTLTTELTPTQQTAFDAFLAANPARSFRFALLDASTTMPKLDENNLVHPTSWYSSRALTGDVTFRSPEGKDVRIVYSKSSTRVRRNGVEELEAVPETIWMEAAQQGVVEVNRNAHNFLIRMLFSNECQNGINPAKEEPLTGHVYQLIQPEKTAAERSVARAFTRKVQGMLDENTHEENVRVAKRLEVTKRLSFDYTAGPDALREALVDAAADSEAVYAATSDSTEKAKALVEQAQKADLIKFRHETREWVYSASGQALQVIPAGEPIDGLAAWLLDTQGTSTRLALKKQLGDKASGKLEKLKGIRLADGEPVPEGYHTKPGKLGLYWPLNQAD